MRDFIELYLLPGGDPIKLEVDNLRIDYNGAEVKFLENEIHIIDCDGNPYYYDTANHEDITEIAKGLNNDK